MKQQQQEQRSQIGVGIYVADQLPAVSRGSAPELLNPSGSHFSKCKKKSDTTHYRGGWPCHSVRTKEEKALSLSRSKRVRRDFLTCVCVCEGERITNRRLISPLPAQQ